MTWYAVYNVADMSIQGTVNFEVPDAIYTAQGQAKIVIPDGTDMSQYTIDPVTLALVPIPVIASS